MRAKTKDVERLFQKKPEFRVSQKRKNSSSVSANRWSVVECYTWWLTHTGLVLTASTRPIALRDCQRSWRDTFTLYLRSIGSLQHHGWTRLSTSEIRHLLSTGHCMSTKRRKTNRAEKQEGTCLATKKKMKNKKSNQIKNNRQKLICHFWKCGWKSYLVLVSSWQILIWFIPLCGVNFHQEEDEAAWEDAAISGLGRGESNGEGKKEKARFATTYLSAFFIIGWKVKTEVTSDSLYLSQIFFFPSLAPGPNSQLPLQNLLASPAPAVYILCIGSHVLTISNLKDRQTIADSRKLDHCDIRVMCRVRQPK